VLAYFTEAGLPRDEVDLITASVTMFVSTSSDEEEESKFAAYTSHVNRVLNDMPAMASIAWAPFNADGEVVLESVYWPAIPAAVLEEAVTLMLFGDVGSLGRLRVACRSGDFDAYGCPRPL
jgi:hypothetical protein